MNEKLLFRRQFILSSLKFDFFKDWKYLELNNGLMLSVHPDLELTFLNNRDIKIILLGFILDPFDPQKNNLDILKELAADMNYFKELIDKTEKYGGRWIIIFQDAVYTHILNDPCGQRQVYYHFFEDQTICASDTSIINYFFPLKMDSSKEMEEFITSKSFTEREHPWIGNGTVYPDVKHLMPNHYLSIHEKRTIRFWPDRSLERVDLETAVKTGSDILQGTLKAANNRSKLAIAVTGGMDSRILLAASKPVKEYVFYYVSVPNSHFRKSSDYTVPKKIFSDLGLPFYALESFEPFPDDMKNIYKMNITNAREGLGKTKFIFKLLSDLNNVMVVNGNAGEIFRMTPYFRPFMSKDPLSNNIHNGFLADPELQYVKTHLTPWYDEMMTLCSEFQLDFQGMFYWEQRIGNWGALYPAEQDIAVDQLSPFNNRLLIRLFSSVDLKYRIFPKYVLFKKIIDSGWPEILKEPVNPLKFKPLLKLWIRHLYIKYINNY